MIESILNLFQSILSRPPGYRELELDDFGNVIAIAKIDPDKLGPRRFVDPQSIDRIELKSC